MMQLNCVTAVRIGTMNPVLHFGVENPLSLNLLEKLPSQHDDLNYVKAKWIWLGVGAAVVFACLCTSSLMRWIAPRDYLAILVYACFGLILSAPFLCALFCTLPSFSLMARLVGTIFGLTVWLVAFGISQLIDPRFDGNDLNILYALPISFAGLCIPLLAVRFWLGWQIYFPGFDPPRDRPKITIVGLMSLTASTAVCFSVLNLGPAGTLEIGIWGMLICTGVSCLFMIPLVGVFMKKNNYWFFFAVAMVLVYSLTWSICQYLGPWLRNPRIGLSDWQCIGIGVSVLAGFTVVILKLIAARIAGAVLLDHTYTAPMNKQLETTYLS